MTVETKTLTKRRSRLFRRLLILSIVAVGGLYMLSFSSHRPDNLGVQNGRLAALPDSLNGVSTQTDDPKRRMDPISFQIEAEAMQQKLVETVRQLPRTHVVTRLNGYLHVEFTSALFRFVDDVEFLIDDVNKLVHFRSASRVGHWDLGANRKRMTKITELLNQ